MEQGINSLDKGKEKWREVHMKNAELEHVCFKLKFWSTLYNFIFFYLFKILCHYKQYEFTILTKHTLIHGWVIITAP